MSALTLTAPTSIAAQIRAAATGVHLEPDEMRDTIAAIMSGSVSDAQIAALLVALALKGETAEEIAGAAAAMRAHATHVRTTRKDAIDVCGTGGDGAGTFNVSTAVAFVVAGAGIAVAKHGNRAMSSRCGSADVLEALGVRIDVAPERNAEILQEHGIAFMFAQTHHPAMRYVAPVRREIGVKTLFNVLGPLTNPAGVQRQVIGVGQPRSQRAVARALLRLGCVRAAVVIGCDGIDEVTLAGPTRVIECNDAALSEYEIAPESVGLTRTDTHELRGGDARENAEIVRRVLGGERGPRRDVVVLNAALALQIAGTAADLRLGRLLAERAIDSGAAASKIDTLVRESNR